MKKFMLLIGAIAAVFSSVGGYASGKAATRGIEAEVRVYIDDQQKMKKDVQTTRDDVSETKGMVKAMLTHYGVPMPRRPKPDAGE